MSPRLALPLVVVGLSVVASWELIPRSPRIPPQVRQERARIMCGDPTALSWTPVEGASRYEVDRTDSPPDRGLFCRALAYFTGQSCRCSSSDLPVWPEVCWSGANRTAVTGTAWSGTASFEGYYRVRSVDASGDAGPWSQGQFDCWIE